MVGDRRMRSHSEGEGMDLRSTSDARGLEHRNTTDGGQAFSSHTELAWTLV